ncbi:MAG: hypothetical protein H5T70_01720 [Chloroflexi bacterium]|nr:hypothetical protein [Chloroflexota bacterium]
MSDVSPVRAILGFVERLRRRAAPAAQAHALEHVRWVRRRYAPPIGAPAHGHPALGLARRRARPRRSAPRARAPLRLGRTLGRGRAGRAASLHGGGVSRSACSL